MKYMDDLNEKSVITPYKWFRVSGIYKKLKEVKGIKKYIITFDYMKDFIERVKKCKNKEIKWYKGLYIFEYKKEKMGFFASSIGAPIIAILLEEFIEMGGKYFIITGGVGVLDKSIKRGEIVIPDSAISDEGTSPHYVKPDAKLTPSSEILSALKENCKKLNLKFHTGKIWTIDGVYRETPKRIKYFKEKGARFVDMEYSAFLSVLKFYKVHGAGIFYAGDYVSERRWHFRGKDMKKAQRTQEKIFKIICETLIKV